MEKLNIAVIFGGQSGEHEVLLSSAQALMKKTMRPILSTSTPCRE
jgi:D-alanine-D-alanine ligase-like ATP-grasp enzyme